MGGKRRGDRPNALREGRAALRRRLEDRRAEIEEAILTRVFAISDPPDTDPLYREGVRASVSTALDYALAAIEIGEERAPDPHPSLLVQARMAASYGTELDTVMRRYLAGYGLLVEYLLAESERAGISHSGLQGLLRGQAALFDHLLALIADEYSREFKRRANSREERRRERVERLLAGNAIDLSGLQYDFSGHHLGLVAVGGGVEEALKTHARSVGCRLLMVRRDEATLWAWFGAGRRFRREDSQQIQADLSQARAFVAIGEPAEGLEGWRLTHHQAASALPVGLRSDRQVVRYADVALVAAALSDRVLAASLRQLYLEPLERGGDGGRTAKKTLRAYFEADRNMSSTAAALGINRSTVASRLRTVEVRIDRSIVACAKELHTALQLGELDGVDQ